MLINAGGPCQWTYSLNLQKKTLCNPSQNPNYKVHSKIEQINLANEPLPIYKILWRNDWPCIFKKEVLETLWTSTIKSYLGLSGLMRECWSGINSDPLAMFCLHILWRQNNENATNKPLQTYIQSVGPRDYRIGSNFWKFYLIRSNSHSMNSFLWWKCLDRIVLLLRVGRCTTS